MVAKAAMVVAGTASGVGKTTVSMGIMAGLVRRGFVVQGFKAGPDFIDPGFHTAITGRPSRNLDIWMLGENAVRDLYTRACNGADVAVIEGVMGLFDGLGGREMTGSTAQLAAALDVPVVLVVDAAAMSGSVAALALGYREFAPWLRLAGVIANGVAGSAHRAMIDEALASVDVPLLGALPRQPAIRLPERHLGLVTAVEHGAWGPLVEALGEWIEAGLDLDTLLGLTQAPRQEAAQGEPVDVIEPRPAGDRVRVAVARDAAFSFYYPENLELLESAGIELVPFSPLRHRRLPPDVHGLILGGGYPEVYATRLAANVDMRRAIAAAIERGLPTYAECGGMMYLCRELIAKDGERYPMVGVLPGRSVMNDRLQSLGYREVEALRDTVALLAGQRARGHEFHYAHYEGPGPDLPAYRVTSPASRAVPGEDGFASGSLLASWVHLHFNSNPALAENLAAAFRGHREGRRERIQLSAGETEQSVQNTPAVSTSQSETPADATRGKGLIIAHTGRGKGKTTAALGLVLRASGHGLRVLVVQFIKGDWKYGEIEALKRLPGVELIVGGRGFTIPGYRRRDWPEHLQAARSAWLEACRRGLGGEADVLVLDEIHYVLGDDRLREAVPLAEVLEFLRAKPPMLHVVLTGRNAPAEIVEMADLVTEMRAVKHPFSDQGIPAQRGVEF